MSTDASRMINKDWAAQVRRAISLVFLSFFFLLSFNKKVTRPSLQTATFAPSYYGGVYAAVPSPGTTHISVLDYTGQGVSLTSTVGFASVFP